MRLARQSCLLIFLALPAWAQTVTQVRPVPIGPHGAYLAQLDFQVQSLLAVPAPLPQAFQATLLAQPEVRTPAAFAARAALVQALARPAGLKALAEAVRSQEGPKAERAARSLAQLSRSIAQASGGERKALGAQAQALNARFDGGTAAPGESVDLSAIATDDEDGPGERKARARMEADRRELSELGEMMAGGKTRGVLVVLQGMDGAGKGGTIKRPLRLNPAWTRVAAFKKPTEEEAAQHFLKRIEDALPKGKPAGAQGFIQIFDRSQYEDLVMPAILATHSKEEIEARYAQVLDFERRLAEAGIVVVKLFLHVSKEVQGERLQERLDTPKKNYKASAMDWKMRKLFPQFQKVWGEVLARTSTPWSIWNVIPADNKPRRDADVARLVLKTLRRMGLSWPENPDLDAIKAGNESA